MIADPETLAAIRWKKICAACAEGTPPERCAYYGEPDGCNAPVRGHHPAGDVAERLKDELADAHDAIARLEAELAEARRERDTACAERALSAVPGSAAALREALTGRDLAFARAAINDLVSDCNAALSRATCEAKNIYIRSAESAAKEAWSKLDNLIRAVLAAPARNCDVGTAREQIERFNDFCRAVESCPNCPLYQNLNNYEIHGFGRNECMSFWGQLPFAPAEGGAE